MCRLWTQTAITLLSLKKLKEYSHGSKFSTSRKFGPKLFMYCRIEFQCKWIVQPTQLDKRTEIISELIINFGLNFGLKVSVRV